MPDISMCANENCDSKFECYRFMACPSEYRQAYANFADGKKVDKCEDFNPLYKDQEHIVKMTLKYGVK